MEATDHQPLRVERESAVALRIRAHLTVIRTTWTETGRQLYTPEDMPDPGGGCQAAPFETQIPWKSEWS